MSDTTRLILFGLLLPGVMGAVVGALGALGARHEPGQGSAPAPSRLLTHAITALVLALLAGALTLATWGVHGPASFPPVSSDDRLRLVPAAMFVAALLGVFARFLLQPRPERPGIPRDRMLGAFAALLAAGAGAALALGTSSLSLERLLAVPATAALAYACCLALISFHELRQHARAGAVLVGVALAAAAALTGTGSLVLGQYGFGAAAIAAGVVLGGLVLRGPTRPFTLAILSAFLAVLVCCGVIFSSTPVWVAGLLGCVVPIAWLVSVAASRRLKPAAAAAVTIAAAALLATIAVAPGIKSLADFVAGSSSYSTGD
jgi:hypothetical protein